jgi:SOS-response transcriptional repressor LexA
VLYNGYEVIKMNCGAILARLRKEKGCTQSEVVDHINRFSGRPYSKKIVSHWENGVSSPSIEQFLLLCELYEVRDIQGTFRGVSATFHDFPKLNALGKSRVEEYITMLSGNPLFSETESTVAELPRRYIRLYDAPVAAGAGAFLDSDAYDDFEVDMTVPEGADFAVKVSGDSMEPRFVDGQIIFIKKQQTLEVGEVGIFELNGDSYVKKLGHGEFISLNPLYKPIKIQEFDSVHIFGKVVG